MGDVLFWLYVSVRQYLSTVSVLTPTTCIATNDISCTGQCLQQTFCAETDVCDVGLVWSIIEIISTYLPTYYLPNSCEIILRYLSLSFHHQKIVKSALGILLERWMNA